MATSCIIFEKTFVPQLTLLTTRQFLLLVKENLAIYVWWDGGIAWPSYMMKCYPTFIQQHYAFEIFVSL